MSNIILTTPEELRAIVNEAISSALPKPANNLPHIDTITLNDLLILLKEHGYPTSKAKIYKLTSAGEIPCKTFGHKLVFSRKEILQWAENQTKPKHDSSEICLALARSARLKENYNGRKNK